MSSEAFQLFKKELQKKKPEAERPCGSGTKSNAPRYKDKLCKEKTEGEKKEPICLYGPHK